MTMTVKEEMEEFFEKYGANMIETRDFEGPYSFTINELYFRFKEKIYDEIRGELISDVQNIINQSSRDEG